MERVLPSFIFLPLRWCVSLADSSGIVPLSSSDRFIDLRPGDALLSYLFFGFMFLAIVISIIVSAVFGGLLAALLVALFVPPLYFLLFAILIRCTLESLRFLG